MLYSYSVAEPIIYSYLVAALGLNRFSKAPPVFTATL